MGIVYLARNPRLNRLVALKVLGELIAADTRGRARLEREAALAARLEHPNIVTIYDRAPSDAAVPWICMKYVGGGDVAQRISERGGPLPDDQAVGILTDAARALDHAHWHGILHRDVKPGNILLDHTAGDLASSPTLPAPPHPELIATLPAPTPHATASTRIPQPPSRFRRSAPTDRADLPRGRPGRAPQVPGPSGCSRRARHGPHYRNPSASVSTARTRKSGVERHKP
ncbi:serine/threonine protein kinase [Nocardia tengchongensis]|uniref:non-specific serine/threonine protein kinase n=1 Tax=Nocardia tengchongensis TaxID=2055889 RepID=A0ABX8CW35_9NOCA|nr:serine/threonine protein kinase [Nocardia tengchongensis]